MDTLLLLEDDEEHVKAIFPNGKSTAPINLGVNGTEGIALISPKATVDQIKAAVISDLVAFADKVTKIQRDNNIAGINPHDNETFQVILEYHQTDLHTAEGIIAALDALPKDAGWLGIPDKYKLSFAVKNAWLMSCESAGNKASNAAKAPKYSDLAAKMINAACSGFKTEIRYPSSNPKEYFIPTVYGFDTGNIITGSTTLNPAAMSFVSTPFWSVDTDGTLKGDDRPIDPNKPKGPKLEDFTQPSSGTIYVFTNGQQTAAYTYPLSDPSAQINIVNFTPPP